MKTILVVYLTKGSSKVSDEEAYKMKKYSFNTEADVQVGDVIESTSYDSPLQVVKILDECFEFVNVQTGELSNKFNSTAQWKIRKLVLQLSDSNTIFGKKR